jgi:CRISPR/Cas system-associated protein Cas7 (RAMP superfamily)
MNINCLFTYLLSETQNIKIIILKQLRVYRVYTVYKEANRYIFRYTLWENYVRFTPAFVELNLDVSQGIVYTVCTVYEEANRYIFRYTLWENHVRFTPAFVELN